jgi:hypothetical protein
LWTAEKGKDVTLDDFTVLKVLGAGAFGTVTLVEEKKTSSIIFNQKYQFFNLLLI